MFVPSAVTENVLSYLFITYALNRTVSLLWVDRPLSDSFAPVELTRTAFAPPSSVLLSPATFQSV